MTAIRLFFEFFKIGLFSVGGGMATLPFLYEMSDRTGWFSHEQIANMLAVSESTPGPIGINMATYVGFQTAGIAGALAATIGVVMPGLILVMIITAMLDKFRNSKSIDGAFYGLRPASVALISAAGILVARITFISGSGIDIKAVLFAGMLLLATRYIKCTKKLHPAVFIFFSAIVGIVFSFAG